MKVPVSIDFVKINKGKPHLNGVRRPEAGALMHVAVDINTDANRKRHTLHLQQEVTVLYYYE